MNKWKQKYFTIWTGQAVSQITSAVLQMAIIWNLTATTNSAMVLSLATMIGFLPQAILGSFIGVLVDRWNRKTVMIVSDVLIALSAVYLFVLSITTGEVSIPVIMAVLFIRSVGTAFHSPAISAITPLLVPAEELTKCAGYTQSMQSFSYLVSPALAAFVYAKWGVNAAILLDVAGAFIACLFVAVVHIPKQEYTSTEKVNFIKEIKEGYSALKMNRGFVSMLLIGALFTLVYMPINALFPLIIMGYFGKTTTHVSISEIVFALGIMLGGIILGKLGVIKKRSQIMIGAVSLMGVVLTVSGLLPEYAFWGFVVCCFFMGFSSPFYNGIQIALFQEKIAPEYLGRVFGLFGNIVALAMPLGLIFSAVFADKVGISKWFAGSGILILGIAVLCISLPSFRKLGEEREQ